MSTANIKTKKRYCILMDKDLTEFAKQLCTKERLSFSQWVERQIVLAIKNGMPEKAFQKKFKGKYPLTQVY